MATTTFDIRQFIDDKRVYKSLKGDKLDFSFRPSAIDEIYKKYTQLETEVAIQVPAYIQAFEAFTALTEAGAATQEHIDKFNEITIKHRTITAEAFKCGIDMIIVAGQANKQDYFSQDWIENNLDTREFGYIIRFIMGTEDQLETKKK